MTELKKKRPEFRNINAFTDLTTYRLPPAGWVSILHRVSGLLMFVLMPFIIWMFDKSISSELSFELLTSAFANGVSIYPGWFLKLVVLALIWGYLHHFTAGVRHLYMDATHAVTQEFGRSSAIVTLAIGLGLTVVLGAKLFGLY
ncbi:MAG: succinate dehydrogenase, cytochrome b556 subunit [Burkholderiaceae bacterium]|jgi:succinate dehydrogenase / fumarate reductase cytochrome b subunit|tara:strand:- start:889 stop:1320 length:432 start_codon:yes stop_codon:yes gene_type:complete